MIDPKSHDRLRKEISARLVEDKSILDLLRREISIIKSDVHPIKSQSSASIALVAADGGNNSLKFDPFMVQLVRVVDSSNNEYCLEAITPTTDVIALSRSQFKKDGTPRTALGTMMQFLNTPTLPDLSYMIKSPASNEPVSTSWIKAYRELVEWAILFNIVRTKDFATDTLLIFDGLLRSKVFSSDNFIKLKEGFAEAIEHQRVKHRRNIYLAGIAKHSKVIERYRLAMHLESILTCDYPAYVEIPREIEEKAYKWSEYARGDDNVVEGEVNRFVAGKMFFVKFGTSLRDPIWPIDIFTSQLSQAPTILGCMLEDAKNGFPVPHYPRCLQRAHDNAALVDFDTHILQDEILNALRLALGDSWTVLDSFLIQDHDPARARYRKA
ncbi:MAG: hypothetical protein ACOH5I_25460 [Oligoflexus sp.]